MDRGTSIVYSPPLGKFSASLERVGWLVLGDQRRGMLSLKSYKYWTVSGRIPKVSWMTVFGKGGELKN